MKIVAIRGNSVFWRHECVSRMSLLSAQQRRAKIHLLIDCCLRHPVRNAVSILISTSVRISGKGEELFLFKLEQGLKRKKKDV